MLKIFAIVCIVFAHCTGSIFGQSFDNNPLEYYVCLYKSTTNWQYFVMTLICYGGHFGNTIFFVCSAWFLLEKSRTILKKIIYMISDVWMISVGILIVSLIYNNGNISFKLIIKSLLPTVFENNWYITCYIIFCMISPFLNYIIKNLSKQTMLRASLVLFVFYMVIHFFTNNMSVYTYSELTVWIAIYFIVAYMKYYLPIFSESKTFNRFLIGIGAIGNFLMVLVINFLGLRFEIASDQLFFGDKNNNLFFILIVIGLFNLVRNHQFSSNIINSFSKMSLLIYIVHENIIFRSLYRPLLWKFVYNKFGYTRVLLWDVVISVIVLFMHYPY